MASKEDNSYDSPLPHERTSMFERFLVYRNLGPKRTIKKTYHTILESRELSEKCGVNNRFSEKALEKSSASWQWVARAELWDAQNILQEQVRREDTFDNVNGQLITEWEGIVGFIDTMLKRIYDNPLKNDGEQYALPSLLKMTKDAVDILKTCNEQIRICCGYHPQNEITIKGDLEVKNKWDEVEHQEEALRIIHETFDF